MSWDLTKIYPETLWIAHAASVWFMTGLIWLIQLVHYPLMNRVAADQFIEFHRAHSSRITWIVAPAMLLQLTTSIALLVNPPPALVGTPVQLAFLLSLGVFCATAFLAIPAHGQLSRGYSTETHQRLVQTNWVRTLLWSTHALLTAWGVRHFI